MNKFRQFLDKNLDKVTHFFVGYFVAHVTYLITLDIVLPLLGVIIAGFGKEYYDKKTTGVWSNLDAIATIFGGMLFVVLTSFRHF